MKATTILFRVCLVLVVLVTLFAGYRLFLYKPAPAAPETSEPPVTTETPTQPPETTQPAPETTEPAPETTEPAPETTEPAPETTEPAPSNTVTLVAVGDNLIHNMVFRSGWGTDPWNYDHLYQHVKADIEAADIAVINQETIFVADHANVSHYPLFGTPREIGDAVYDAGFDVILHASNHVMDKGLQNIYDAIDYWSDKDVTVLGIHKSAEDAKLPKIVEKNGIKIGMINYTYGMNGFTLPADQSYAVDLLDYKTKLMDDIAYLEENADITVAFFHIGDEYSVVPSIQAKALVEKTVAAGVDLVIDCHPHVVEPYEKYTAENGNTAVVYYSLGNFVSAQTEMDRLLGGMASLTIVKDEEGTRVTDYTMIPLVTHTSFDNTYGVYKLEDYTDALCAKNVLYPMMTTKMLWDRFHQIVGE